ncbi:MAG: YcgN family cysteine cluster protein [Gammaproteobacteria bacterium]|nr:YcgN family cysteine cluster protein [Gammaproteobacteria bacterium]
MARDGGWQSIVTAFWQVKSLAEMNEAEWESLCDGCGKCCLHKLLDERDDLAADAPMQLGEDLHYTHIACQLLDCQTGRCSDYANRHQFVPDCVQLTVADLPNIHFMPPSCAYRRLHEGRELPSWHPLLNNGSRAAMIAAGMSVATHQVISEREKLAEEGDIVHWPLHDID